MKRLKRRLFAFAVIALFLFAVSYAKYMSEAAPDVKYEPVQSRIVITSYSSYIDWLLESPTVEIRQRELPEPRFDPSQLSPLEELHLQDEPQPITDRPR